METRYGLTHDCEKCGREAKFHAMNKRRSYGCHWCGHQVFPTADTPMHRTRTPLRDWFYVIFLFCASRNGVAAKEVERQIGVTYKTAWRMCHMIREYMGVVDGDDPVGGNWISVEIDETYVGGVRPGKRGRGAAGKTVVLGMMENDGNVMTKVVPNVKRSTLIPLIAANVRAGSVVSTDELRSYSGLVGHGYQHITVNHGAGQYADRKTGATVNSIEGFWAQLKRGIYGTHIHVSGRHLSKYLGEFEFRHNMRHAPHLMLPRLMASFAR